MKTKKKTSVGKGFRVQGFEGGGGLKIRASASSGNFPEIGPPRRVLFSDSIFENR